ncbi:HEAT repeat domain-containing protein [Nannocystis punicea]|uniref:HEAT repeat domain-containing protein n=1 Tax=Nannocystis punicea TaxID=2995304 RepID=A0ABY7H0M7_9BACT|nr:HEAT repeat domain-containing protein [Nannocystis poenicansa]WAS92803.1 HEAT repeat domain-containing protein [Nannocystis poenicansa]
MSPVKTGAQQLEELARASSKWTTIEAIRERPAADLLAEARARFAARPDRRAELIELLQKLPGDAAEALLVEWLDDAFSAHHATVLRALAERGSKVSDAILERLLASATATLTTPRKRKLSKRAAEQASRDFEVVLEAVGCLGDPRLAPVVARHLDAHPYTAALALGRLGARDHVTTLLARLPDVPAKAQCAIVAALELLGDPAAAPGLLEQLRTAPDEVVYELHHTLGQLVGWEPLLPLYPENLAQARAHIRAGWAGFDVTRSRPAPQLEQVALTSPHELRFCVVNGLGIAREQLDPPPRFSSWLRWGSSLSIAGRPLYRLGSHCETCEAHMRLGGWPPERAAEVAGAVRDALADTSELSLDWLAAMTPLLTTLRTGHWIAARAEFDLERVTAPEQSWWSRRGPYRKAEDADIVEVWSPWPGTEHFQVREPLSTEPPTFGVLMPTQPLAALDEATVSRYEQAIRAGARPACLVLAWIDQRTLRGECEERLLLAVVLDGHHKLAAYARCGVPAPAVLLCRLEDTWGPPGERERWFLQAALPVAE